MQTRNHPLFTRSDEPASTKCGFSLKGLGPEGACPECGTAYDAATAYPWVPPTTLTALWYGTKPVVLGTLPAFAALTALLNSRFPEGTVILAAVGLAFVGCACVSWSAWRSAMLIDALAIAKPQLGEHRPALHALGCGATGVLGIVGVLSLGICGLLAFTFGSCVLSGLR